MNFRKNFINEIPTNMKYKQHKQYRLPDFDYSGEGEYFVTICVDNRKHYFGEIKNSEMILSELGKIVDQYGMKFQINLKIPYWMHIK